MTRKRALLAVLATGSMLAATGCGDDDDESGESDEPAVTADQAIDEIGAVRAGLDEALAQYRGGDADAAETTVEDAYLEHFELVEGPLEEADAELNEGLEELIREEITGEIAADAPVKDVEDLVAEANDGLDDAEKALAGA